MQTLSFLHDDGGGSNEPVCKYSRTKDGGLYHQQSSAFISSYILLGRD